jgi:hypothetical protein
LFKRRKKQTESQINRRVAPELILESSISSLSQGFDGV